MAKTSLLYKNAFIYESFMRLLYGKHYKARYISVGEEIPDGVKVLDVCCGPCALYTLALRGRADYRGIDINQQFIENAAKLSVTVLPLDIRAEPLPDADYVVMQGSLYQFVPRQKEIVDKLLSGSSDKVIISEPVRNLSNSRNPLISAIARHSTDPGTGHKEERFTEESFRAFFTANYSERIEKFKFVPGGRDFIVVLNARKEKERAAGRL